MKLKAENVTIGSQLLYKGEVITALGIAPHCGDYAITTKSGWVYLKNCDNIKNKQNENRRTLFQKHG